MNQDLSNRRILLLHGLTKSPMVFSKLINNLENRGSYCFAPALTGHRNNPPYAKDVCLHNFISELDEYVDSLSLGGKSEILVVGHSFGALLALALIPKYEKLISKLVLISPPIEFRNLGTRLVLPLLRFIPGYIAKHLGSIRKSRASDGDYELNSSYSVNMLCVMSQLRKQIFDTNTDFNKPTLLIQSSYDRHVNPYSLYYLKNRLLGDSARIVLRDWGPSHDILELEDALSIVSNFLTE